MEKKVPIEDVCKILEIPVSFWIVEKSMSSEQAKVALGEFKDIVKNQRKVLAKKYHPDMPRGDELKMKVINDMVDIVMKLEITVLKPKPQKIKFHFYSNTSRGSFFNDGSTDFFRF